MTVKREKITRDVLRTGKQENSDREVKRHTNLSYEKVKLKDFANGVRNQTEARNGRQQDQIWKKRLVGGKTTSD